MATRQQAADRVEARLWLHLAAYVAVVSSLAILNYTRSPDNLWVLWVAGGWGLGLVAHAFAFFSRQGRARMIDRTEARMDRQEARHRRHDARHDTTHMTDKMSDASQFPPPL